ncbi:uncharacterized protein LOC131060512 [Cryptomeria japonica]|uniref:uncharacterized protein LOC131060512 n=1 Tax=Cryptomeria japonica TaxID=3369 RepID=UPI0025ABD91B|nr:uncharacterized protein LOC131060512 [Cryptomeria japonica]XP_057849736.1 uncharacterized protein LOC131060512 [Cryptomeria japonica]XP_057849737.1 uncharacterized protein LOC131060512 [Cryptomeria japonica]
MQSSVQTGGRSASPLSRSKSNPEHPPSPAYSASGRTKKRDRSDKSVDSSKKKRSAEPPEIGSLVDKDGGLLNFSAVDGLYLLMLQDLNKSSRKLKDIALRRTSLAAVISSTVRDDCLKKFVDLGGLSLLNNWLQDAHKGKLGDGVFSEENDRTIDDLILTLLQALEKLPVDLDALKTSNAGKSVKNLRSHADSKIHRKAKKLVDAWKRRVNAEMKQSEEAKTGSKHDVCRPYKPIIPKDSPSAIKNGGSLDANLRSSGAFGNVVKNTTTTNSSSMGEAAMYLKKGGAALSTSGGASNKESPSRMQLSNSPPGEADGVSVPDERSSNSNQPLNNGVLWSTAPMKNAVTNWKEDSKGSVGNAGTTKGGNSRSHITSKGVNAGSKEAGIGKSLPRSASAGTDKKTVVPACEKISNESMKVEAGGNNQRLILRIPNNARSSLSSSFADAAVPSSKDSSSNVAERNLELKDRKSRLQNAPLENANMKTSSSRHDDVEKHADVPKRRNEMDCHSSESYMSFSSTECCTLDYKKSHQFQEGQQANEMTHESSKNNGSRSNGCGTEDINAGISLLASIAADENLRIEANAALTAFEEQRNAKDSENQHQGARTACLTDSENSPMSGITENSGRIEVAPDADAKDAQGNCDYLKPGSGEGAPNLGISAGALDTDFGHSDENVKTSEGNSSETKPSGGKSEGTCCLPSETRPRSPSGRSLDDSRSYENEVTLHVTKDFSAPEGNGVEEKETPLHAKSGAAFLVDASSAGEKKNCANSTPKESAYEIPGEDAIEVAMQVAKEATMQVVTEVKEEMENYVKVSLESDDKMATSLGQKKAVPLTDNPVSERHTCESIDQKNDDKDDAGDKKSYIGVKEEKMNYSEDKEAEQTCTYTSFEGRPIKNLGTEDLDERLRESSSSNESKKPMHTVQLQNSSFFTAVEPKETVKAELSSYLEAPGKLRFDLNEGIHLEESPHETVTAVSYPIASIPITPVAFHPVNSSSLSGIIPPPSVLQGKGELGWKGSAATSAFRPAEPRKIQESCQNATESTTAHVPSASISKPARPLFDFDLNIAEEEPIDEAIKPNQTTQNSSSSRLDLDLNRLDESEENGAVLASELVNTEGHSSAKISKTIKHDFDLNAVLGMDDTATADHADPRRNPWASGYGSVLPFTGFKTGSDMVSLHPPWNQLGSTFTSPPIPALGQVRQDTPFSASMSPTFFNVGQGQSIPPFHPEMCRPSAEPLSSTASALPYPIPHSSTFQYAQYNVGFTSAPFSAPASFLDSSGSASYAPMAPPFLTSGAIHASPSRPGFSEIGAAVSSNGIWPRPSLDLNAGPSFDLNSGPEHTDADVREDRTAMRQAPVFPNTFPFEQKIRVLRQSVDPSDSQKRKEPEAAWDLYRTEAVTDLTDVNARDERVTLRQMPVFGNPFSIDEQHFRTLRQPEPVESLKRKEPEGGWDYRAVKQPTWR